MFKINSNMYINKSQYRTELYHRVYKSGLHNLDPLGSEISLRSYVEYVKEPGAKAVMYSSNAFDIEMLMVGLALVEWAAKQ